MRTNFLLALLLASLAPLVTAQEEAPESPTPERKAGWERLVDWRSIGPAVMSGRITALAVYESDPTIFYAATASGGLLKTTDSGRTFVHLFDREEVVSLGDVQVFRKDPNVVWVGTGEGNPRNSVSWGNGVYRSTDGGKTWKHLGLEESFQIGRIALHPENPEVAYVGALGRLWGENEERGLYKTTDGGETWEKVLALDARTGVIEVKMHPEDPDVLLVASYERMRDGFDGNDPAKKHGEGSGLWKTSDGGKSWRKIEAGLPDVKLGRIGLDFYRKNPDIVYMVLESELIGQEPEDSPYLWVTGEDADVGARLLSVRKEGPAARAGLKKGDIVLRVEGEAVMSYGDLLDALHRHRAGDAITLEYARARKLTTVEVTLGKRPPAERGSSRRGDDGPQRPHGTRLGGQVANRQSRQGPDGHRYGGTYRSEDGGETWTRINSLNPRPMYFSQIRVDPSDENHIWVLGIPLYHSKDGGKTFASDGARQTHVDHHALWIDPEDGRHMILGNDGGIYVTRDRGEDWDHLNHVAIGQFYHVNVGPRYHYRVYGGLQDNGTWGGPSSVTHDRGIANEDWFRVGGGDGFICYVDPDDPDLVYYESQNGSIGRRHLGTGASGFLRPRAQEGSPYRFNWKTPFALSHHNGRIYYAAGNYLFRSVDRGQAMRRISPELTRTKKGSGSAVGESPRRREVLYVGTTDGMFWASEDFGQTWREVWQAEDPIAYEAKVRTEARRRFARLDGDGDGTIAKDEFPRRERKAFAAVDADDDGLSLEELTQHMLATSRPQPTPEGKVLSEVLPGRRWVSSISASRFSDGRVYASFDGHRSDDDAPHAVVSEDYGRTWRSLTASLPAGAGSVRCIREDLVHEEILWLGCEFGAWVSLDRGKSWRSLNTDLPTVSVHELAQHGPTGEVVAGTHGRSLWVLDATPLRALVGSAKEDGPRLLGPRDAVIPKPAPRRGSTLRRFVGENRPSGAVIHYHLPGRARSVALEILGPGGEVLRRLDGATEAGFQRVSWDLRREAERRGGRRRRGRRVAPGAYALRLVVDGEEADRGTMRVRLDPDHPDTGWFRALLENEEAEERGEAPEEEEESGPLHPGPVVG